MATVVLTAVGSIFGGPVGAAIGNVVGQQIDRVLLAPKGRQGPRLGDLSVQTSRYGSAIPKLYGAVRVAGTVIWSTDLIETRGSQSNGKGRAKTDTYNYSASFAVALSARRVGRVGRIWADGNLLRGAAGDFKTATNFRFLTGDEDQALDPLIAAAEGLTTTPAYRGCAVAVFEDFQLADYGNRIPTLSFELFAEETPVSVAQILSEISGGSIVGTSPAFLQGIAVAGDSVRGAATTLSAALPVSLRDDGAVLQVVDSGALRALVSDDLGVAGARAIESRRASSLLPDTLAIAYYDATRDYQQGVQRARRRGGSRREDRIDMPATLTAATAKAIIEARLSGLWRERRSIKITLPWKAIDLCPGDLVTIPGDTGVWRIAATTFAAMAVELELAPVTAGSQLTPAADPGRSVGQVDRLHGPTVLVLIDLPPLNDTVDSTARVVVAANGSSPGWRSAPLLASRDGGVSYDMIGGTAPPAIMGRTVTILGIGAAELIDRTNTVDVLLANSELSLNDADTDALLAGTNLAVAGTECIQFGRALALGGQRWRLSELWRGRRGTEAAIANHTVDEAFVLIDPATLARMPDGYAIDGLRVLATGVGDGAGVAAVLPSARAAVTPLSPIRLTGSAQGGDLLLSWIRRSRAGWRWDDAVETPLGEERELYRVTRDGAGLTSLSFDVATPSWVYSAAQKAADRAAGATVITIAVTQVGSRRVSAATTTTFTIN